MATKLKKLSLRLLSLLFVLPIQVAIADTGPKPGMEFALIVGEVGDETNASRNRINLYYV